MSDILNDVLAAQKDRKKYDKLISAYLPFLKKQLVGLDNLGLEYDDMLSLAMLTFAGCIQQYTTEKGAFLAFSKVCIRNRLLDESRKQKRYSDKIVPLVIENEDGFSQYSGEVAASITAYNVATERSALAQEIAIFSTALSHFSIEFSALVASSPKQARSRELCMRLAEGVVESPILLHEVLEKQKLPQLVLAERFQISPKTIEKHRRYIVMLVVLYAGDYPYIRAFLPK